MNNLIHRRLLAGFGAALLLGIGACDDDDPTGVDEMRTYEVTVENLTSGQPFSPGILATHDARTSLFRVGSQASAGIRDIAENGSYIAASRTLPGQPGVDEVMPIEMPTPPMGKPMPNLQKFRILARPGTNRVSLAVMLICTNDAFTGIDSMELPDNFQPVMREAEAYDGGSEANNELFTHIVDPCQINGPVMAPPDGNQRASTEQVITMHPGIQGNGNLDPAKHGWQNPVARITVQRVQ